MKTYKTGSYRYDDGFRPYVEDNLVPTIRQASYGKRESNVPLIYETDNSNGETRIRMLSGLEEWRLMGFDDEDYQKAAMVNRENRLMMQAGNSIVVNVLEAIFRQML